MRVVVQVGQNELYVLFFVQVTSSQCDSEDGRVLVEALGHSVFSVWIPKNHFPKYSQTFNFKPYHIWLYDMTLAYYTVYLTLQIQDYFHVAVSSISICARPKSWTHSR